MDKLHTTSHVLHCNIVTLRAVQKKAEQSPMIWHPSQMVAEKGQFSHNAQSIIQELEFEHNQVQLIIHRLEAVIEMIRDLVHLRSTHNMEKMSSRTILEARTMRIIAFMTLVFLPPTFIAGFLQMGYLDIESEGGRFVINTEPGLSLYFAITLPVVFAVVGGYLWWDRRSTHAAQLGNGSAV